MTADVTVGRTRRHGRPPPIGMRIVISAEHI